MFRIALDGDPLDYPLTVSFVMSGLAVEGTDYTISHSGQVTIPAGERFIDIVLTPIDDHEDEGVGENADLDIIDDDHYDTHKYRYWDSIFIADDDPRPAELTTPDDNSGDMEPEDPCGCGPGGIEPNLVKGSATIFAGGNGQVDCTAPDLALNTGTNPHPVVSVEWALPAEPGVSPAAPPPTVVATATLGGVTADPVHYGTDGFEVGDRVRIALQTDAGSLPTGRHPYSIELKTLDANGDPIPGQTQTFHGHTTVFNRSEAAGTSTVSYGLGWWMTTLDRLVEGAGGVTLVRANATAGWFAHTGGVSYSSPNGSRTEVSAHAGGWTLQHPDGGTSTFDGAGLLTARADRNGNTTTYAYLDADGDGVADELEAVTDPFGRIASYAYDGNGRLQTRTDFFGRVTTYAYDGNGRLESVTQPDPDGAGPGLSPVTTYGYDPSTGQLVTITDAEGGVTTLTYENRLLRAIERPGRGAAEQYVPVNAQGLAPPGTGTAANPAPLAPASGGRATLTDATGRITTIHYDGLGNPTRIIDPLGHVTRIERNVNGQPTRLITPDPDGPEGPLGPAVTNYAYDARGNLSSMTLPDGRTRSWTYAPHRSWVTSFTDEESRTTTFANSATGNPLTTTDPLGRVTTYTYQDIVGPIGTVKGLLSTVTLPDPDGTPGGQGPPTTTFAYDSLGRLTTITDPGNESVTLAYDAQENLQSVTDELGRTTTFTYDALGRQTGTILPDPIDPGAVVTDPAVVIAYRRDGRVASATDLLGRTTTYGYDLGGRLTSITLPHPGGPGALDPTSFAYDAADRLIAETDPLGRVTTYGYDGAGRLETVTRPDPNGLGGPGPVTAYAYDHRGRLIAETDPLGRVTTFAYDLRDRLVALTRPDPDGPGGQDAPTTTFTYTPSGRLRTVTGPDPDGPGGQDAPTTTYTYDLADRLTAVTEPDPDGPGGQGAPTTTYTYDRLDRLTAVTDPLGRVTTYSYNVRDRLEAVTRPATDSQAATTVAYTYTATGLLSTVTRPDPDGPGGQAAPVTTYSYDRRDRLTTITDPEPATGIGSPVTTYGYDGLDRLTHVTDAEGDTTIYGYDGLDRLITVTDPNLGTTVTGYDAVGNVVALTDPEGNTTTYAYDALDRVTIRTDPRGKATTFAYDLAGRLTETTDRLGRRTAYDYDDLDRRTAERWLDGLGGTIRTIASAYDGLDRLVALADPAATLEFSYDGLGRLLSESTEGDAPGQPSLTLSSAYDAAGNRTRLADDLSGPGAAGAGVTSFAYDALDRVTTISRSLGGVAGPEVTLGYDTLDRLTGMTRTAGVGTATLVSSFAYDALDRLTSLTHDKLGGATLASFSYDYDLAGRVTGAVDARGAATYTYDGLGQLTAVDRPGTEADESYGYDAAGNRTGAGYATGLGNRLESAPGFSYAYDDEGNRVSQTETATGRVTTYAYDHRNRMTGATVRDAAGRLTGVTTYRYDALDRRIGTEVLRGPTYVSDLPFSATQRVDNISNPPPVRRDTSTDPAEPLRLDGTTYLKGLGASGESTILVDLDGRYDRFRAVVGIDDEARPGGRVAFRVYDARPGGDVLLYDSGELWGGASGAIAQPIDISVAGVETLKLYVDPRGNTNYDWANWADAHLVPLGEVTYLSDLPFSSIQDGGGGGGFNVPVQIDAHAGALGGDPANFPLALTGITYAKGLGAVGASEITVELDGNYDRFRAVVGVDDGTDGGGLVAFRVYDEHDTLLFDSGPMQGRPQDQGGSPSLPLDIGVTGVQTLKLVVDPLGAFAYDWANWADAHLIPVGEVAYLSDLPFSASQLLDNDATPPVRRDASANPALPLVLDGITYAKGLGAHAHSSITLDLDGQYDRFRAVLGVDDQVPGTGLVAFRVYDARPTGDVLLYDSGPRQKGDPALPLDLVVAGIASLKLVVDPQGVTDYDWADWADAHLIPKSDLGLTRAAPERTWTAYDGLNPYADFDADGNLEARYLHGPALDWLLARSDAEGSTDWYLTDRLGSVRALANAQGAVINRLDYDAYGHLARESHPAAGDRFGFTARERDPVTGLQYNRHRYYDAAIGGWTQEDPIGFAGGDPNLYRYVGNSPTNFTDPSGLAAGYWEGVGDVFRGYGDAALGTAHGLWFMGRHPVQTARGVATAACHPIQTGEMILEDIKQKSGTLRGQGELVGDVLIGVASGGTLKSAAKAETVVKVSSKLRYAPIQGAKGRSPWTADLSHVTGKTAQARNRAIDAVISEDLPDLKLTFHPEYSPFASQGVAKRGVGTQIGKSPFSCRAALRDTIVHEELHHRWWKRGVEGWHHSPDELVPNERFYEVLHRYRRMRGWE